MPTLSNLALAIYISNTGEVVATEQIAGGRRDIAENQLDALPEPSDAAEVLQVNVRVNRLSKSGTDCGPREYVAMRVCYDMSGRRVPCF